MKKSLGVLLIQVTVLPGVIGICLYTQNLVDAYKGIPCAWGHLQASF